MQPGKLALRLTVQTGFCLALMGALLLLGAGRWDWPQAWAFLAIYAALSAVFGVVLLKRDPGLLAARLGNVSQPGQPLWDKVFLVVFILIWLGWLVLMGADAQRWNSSHMSLALNLIGAVVTIGGFLAVMRVLLENSFAAPVVRMQAERTQRVIDTGPYAWVRHPMYATALIFLIGIPLLLGSWLGFIGVVVILMGMAGRAVAEENLLRHELPGYAGYMTRVRYRLIPYIW